MSSKTFDILIFNGRPAAGKSEIIDFLKKTPLEERIERFHIGEFEEFDDFPILWDGFESDDIFEKHGKERLMSTPTFEFEGKTYTYYHFKDDFYWHFLIDKLSYNYTKKLKADPDYHKTKTTIFEFARGSQHGGWTEAYNYLYDDILKKACTMYIDVTHEESIRKNLKRKVKGKEDNILHHSLVTKYLDFCYKESDWKEFSEKDPNYLLVKGNKIPYSIFNNMPERTNDQDKIAPHLEEVLNKLWKIKRG